MKKIAILTDSASNIKEDESKGIFVVPLYVIFDEVAKKDLEEITPQELYDTLETKEPTTSAPSSFDFEEKIRRIIDLGYDGIVGIAISSAISATFNAMKIALEEINIKHELVDSLGGSHSEGYLAMEARKLLDQGKSLEEVGEILREMRKNTRLFAIVNDLKYLIRGGRLPYLKGMLGKLFKVNPILSINKEGKIENYASVRGKSNALKKLKEIVAEDLKDAKSYYFSAIYARDKVELENIRKVFKDIIDNAKEYFEVSITSVVGAQVGPNLQCVTYLKLYN